MLLPVWVAMQSVDKLFSSVIHNVRDMFLTVARALREAEQGLVGFVGLGLVLGALDVAFLLVPEFFKTDLVGLELG